MPETPRNAPCPCGSGRKYKACHGAPDAAGHAPPPRPADPERAPEPGDNPFHRIFRPDGTIDTAYVSARMKHLQSLLEGHPDFLPLRYDRQRMEGLLGRSAGIFGEAKDDEGMEKAFRAFAEAALPDLVTREFDDRLKEAFKIAIRDPRLSRRDRAAAACGLIYSLPEKGEPVGPAHENPLFDLILRVTFNESLARDAFLAELDGMKEITEAEREARYEEFLRAHPALLYELRDSLQRVVRKALKSWERGDYSFGLGADMLLHGVRAVRMLTEEMAAQPTEGLTEEARRLTAERFVEAIRTAFDLDIAEEEEQEILDRMAGFREEALRTGAERAVNGLRAALDIMSRNPEVRRRMLLAAYHQAISGQNLFLGAGEEVAVRALFEKPLDPSPYLAYGEALLAAGAPFRAERVYRAAFEFFPEDAEIRRRLEAVATSLEGPRDEALRARLGETDPAE